LIQSIHFEVNWAHRKKRSNRRQSISQFYLSVFFWSRARCNFSPREPRLEVDSPLNACQFCSSAVLPGARVIFLSPGCLRAFLDELIHGLE
jgi:hypothetical protein